MMKRENLAKALAIFSSLTLAGCFVAYRQNHAREGDKVRMMPGSKNPGGTTVFPSSKNIDAVLFPSTRGKSQDDSTISPEGRVGGDFVSPVDGIPAEPPKTPAKPTPEKKLLPGSKIGAILSADDVPVTRQSINAISDGEHGEKKASSSGSNP